MALDPSQHADVEAAFAAAQLRTRAPIVCVLARASAHYEWAALAWSGLIGLITPWPLLTFTQLSAQRIFIAQLAVCFAATAILSLTPLRLRLTPIRLRRANAHRAALTQFAIRGLDHAGERSGVLVYVSLAERYARVVAAESASQAIDQSRWQGLVDALTADLSQRGPAEALAKTAGRCADLLAPVFPPQSDASPQRRQHFHVV